MPKLLLVHSDPKLTDIYSRKFQQHFAVDSARSGLTALRKIRLAPPHIIFCQDELPYLSGFALLRYLRRRPHLASIPFIFLSKDHAAPDALSLGGNEWINTTKVDIGHLLDRALYHLTQNYRFFDPSN
ncbi:MAG: response regulator [Candidatus Saccharibacteria bacterium]